MIPKLTKSYKRQFCMRPPKIIDKGWSAIDQNSHPQPKAYSLSLIVGKLVCFYLRRSWVSPCACIIEWWLFLEFSIAATACTCNTCAPHAAPLRPAAQMWEPLGLRVQSLTTVLVSLVIASGLNQIDSLVRKLHHISHDVLLWSILHTLSYPIKGRKNNYIFSYTL